MNTSTFLNTDSFTNVHKPDYLSSLFYLSYEPQSHSYQHISTRPSFSSNNNFNTKSRKSCEMNDINHDALRSTSRYYTSSCSTYSTDNTITTVTDSNNQIGAYREYERESKENGENWPVQTQTQNFVSSEYAGPLERRPLQDLTNLASNYSPPFKSRAYNVESNYRSDADKVLITRSLRREIDEYMNASSLTSNLVPNREADMTFYSRPLVYNTEPKQNCRVSYSEEICAETVQMENSRSYWTGDRDLTVNNIIGKRKPKSKLLTMRMRPELNLNTSYNSNAHVIIIAGDSEDAVDLKNLMKQDSYMTRAGFFEMSRS